MEEPAQSTNNTSAVTDIPSLESYPLPNNPQLHIPASIISSLQNSRHPIDINNLGNSNILSSPNSKIDSNGLQSSSELNNSTGPPISYSAIPNIKSPPTSSNYSTPYNNTHIKEPVVSEKESDELEEEEDDEEDEEGGNGKFEEAKIDKDDKTKGGRRKINIEFIKNKSRRHVTFSKRKAGLIKKAYELSTLTGTQVLLLVASETGNVYTFATPKLQPLISKPEGKTLIQSCLNPPDESNRNNEAPPAVTTPQVPPQMVPNPMHLAHMQQMGNPQIPMGNSNRVQHNGSLNHQQHPEYIDKKLPIKDMKSNMSDPLSYPPYSHIVQGPNGISSMSMGHQMAQVQNLMRYGNPANYGYMGLPLPNQNSGQVSQQGMQHMGHAGPSPNSQAINSHIAHLTNLMNNGAYSSSPSPSSDPSKDSNHQGHI